MVEVRATIAAFVERITRQCYLLSIARSSYLLRGQGREPASNLRATPCGASMSVCPRDRVRYYGVILLRSMHDVIHELTTMRQGAREHARSLARFGNLPIAVDR